MAKPPNNTSGNPPISRRGLMLVLSSPSGAGKTSISRAILAADDNISMSVSVTTRPQRKGEKEGVDYYFIDAERFLRGAAASTPPPPAITSTTGGLRSTP